MTRNEILRKIGIIIIELREQYDLTQLNRDDMNDIDLELFAANAHFLAEHVEILRKLNNQASKPLRNPEPTFFEPVIKPAEPDKKEPEPNLAYVEEEEETWIAPVIKVDEGPEPIIRHELVVDEEVMMNVEEPEAEQDLMIAQDAPQTETPEPLEEELAAGYINEPEMVVPAPTIEDEEEKPILTINQRISAQMNANARAAEQHLPPITDLKSAITLNDKLLFVRDLFNGYSMAYSEAIEILNRFSRFEEADQFLRLNYYAKNDWEAKQATTDKFYQLLQRRFAVTLM